MMALKFLLIVCLSLPFSFALPTDPLAPTSRPKRPSLHEILKGNPKYASVSRNPVKKEVKEVKEDQGINPEVVQRSNRRSLLLEGEDVIPNYVFDDKNNDDTDTKDVYNPSDEVKLRRQRDDSYADYDNPKRIRDKTVGDGVTQEYAKNYGLELPSYADPNFLAAVMSQADEANFRYPIENKGAIIGAKDQSMSGSAKIETYADGKLPDLNPYEMFPPAFHELLDIPIHVYRNGTTYNPHDKYKKRKFNPIVTKGYANTNVNGNPKINKNKLINRMKPKRITNRIKPSNLNPVDYFESKKIDSNSKIEEIPNVQPDEVIKPSVQINKQPPILHKKEVDSRDSIDNMSDKESENLTFQSRRKTKLKPLRPSLKFRTTSPPTITKKFYSTESSEIKKLMTTTPLPVPTPETSDNFDNSFIDEDYISPPVSNIRTFESSDRERPVQQFKNDNMSPISNIRTFESSERERPVQQFKNNNMSPISNIRTFESSDRESSVQQFKNENISPHLSNIRTTFESSERERPIQQYESDSMSPVSNIRTAFGSAERERPIQQFENDNISPVPNIRTTFGSSEREEPTQQLEKDDMSPPASNIYTFESSRKERPIQQFEKVYTSPSVSDIRNTFEGTEREKPIQYLEEDYPSYPVSDIRSTFEGPERENPTQHLNNVHMKSPVPNTRTQLESSERERPMDHFEPRPIDVPEEMPEDLNPTFSFDANEEDEQKKKNFVPSHFEGSRRESVNLASEHGNFKFPDRDNFLKFDVKDKIRKQTPFSTDKEMDDGSFINQSSFKERPNYFEQPFKEPKLQKKKPSKFDHKPSVHNPYSVESSFTPFSKKKEDSEKIILPTTFRPLHSLSLNSATFNSPSNVFLNEPPNKRDSFYKPLKEPQEKLYGSPVYEENLPFTNSHSLIKPFRQYTIQNGPQERREPQLERGVPVYISSPIRNSVQLIQREFERFGQHSDLSADLRPPPTQEQHEKSFNDRFSFDFNPSARIFSEIDNDREINSNNNKPSFFEKLGFFRPKQVNRNGLSLSKSSGFEPVKKNPHTVEYVLSNGPAPVNARKVVVVGPFKEPPIGAPVFIPESEGQRDGNEGLFQVPPPSLNSDRKAKANEDDLYEDNIEFEKPRGFRFGNNNIFDNNESRDIVVQSQFEVGDQSQIESNRYRQGSVSSVNRFISPPGYSQEPKRSPSFQEKNLRESKPMVRSAVQVNQQNYKQFEEVSEEDKNRLIAAKFKIPRISSIRRSGLLRNIIPIPVPLMTSSGEQILGFQNIQVPNSPVVKKTGRLLDTNLYNNIEINVPSKNSKIENLVKEPKITVRASPSTVIRAAHGADAFDKIINVGPPQSYREPSVSKITFGGWQAVGDSPVKSYVKESSPFVFIKAFGDKSGEENNPEDIVVAEIIEEVEE